MEPNLGFLKLLLVGALWIRVRAGGGCNWIVATVFIVGEGRAVLLASLSEPFRLGFKSLLTAGGPPLRLLGKELEIGKLLYEAELGVNGLLSACDASNSAEFNLFWNETELSSTDEVRVGLYS